MLPFASKLNVTIYDSQIMTTRRELIFNPKPKNAKKWKEKKKFHFFVLFSSVFSNSIN